MKKALLYILILLCVLGSMFGCSSFNQAKTASPNGKSTSIPLQEPEKESTSTPLQEKGDQPNIKSDSETEKTISGTVYDGTMQTITLETKDGNRYLFIRSPNTTETGADGILIGCPVTVIYKGTLTAESNGQNVTVVKIIVGDLPKVELSDQQQAQNILKGMTLEEKVGQMFIVRCPKEKAVAKVSEYHLGGYILFDRDFKAPTKAQVIANNQSYQRASKIPMLISVDEEGGPINRISLYQKFRAVPFWSSQDLYKEGGLDLIISDTKEKCTLLNSLGINLNLAPVCDVSTNSADYIYGRTFGKTASLTATYIKTVVETMNSMKMGSALKHFPGYGNNVDTHTGISYDKRPYQTFETSDFLPFIAGIKANAGAVLVSHNIVTSMDAEHPASLSLKIHRILREELGFQGVIMTDDLYMQAIKQFTGEQQAAVTAVLAKNDLICCTDFEVQIPAVITAVKNGTIAESQIDESVTRILLWKLKLGFQIAS